MKTINIKAEDFFELLKLKDQSMWEIFAQLIDGQEKLIIFSNTNGEEFMEYLLPSTLEQLKNDQSRFSEEYAKKLAENN
jgi:predicted CopG family antitoxin